MVRLQIALGLGVVVAAALLAFIVLPVHRQHPKRPPRFSSLFATVNEGAPVAVSPTELAVLAAHLKVGIYWAGPQAGHTLKFRTTRYGNAVLVYLSAGTPLSTKAQTWLTVITNPYESDPYAQLVRDAALRGYRRHRLAGGSLAFSSPNGKEVYFAGPHSQLLIEVYDPSKGVALREVLSGHVRSVE